jgi:cell wall-associated NlpC family hydrolase
MPYGIDPRLRRAIETEAPEYLRPVLEATAMTESGGRLDAVGDNGNSGGPYQENSAGRGHGIPMAQRMDPVAATRRAAAEFQRYYDKGLRGAELAYAAQRPADKAGYINKVNQYLQGITPASGSSSLGEVTGQQPRQPLPSKTEDMGMQIAQSYMNRRKGEGLFQSMKPAILQSVMSTVDETLGAGAVSPEDGVALNPDGASGVVGAAQQQLGQPYAWGGGTPSGPSEGFAQGAGTVGFDCSSLVQYAWAKAGVKLPRTTYEQIKVGRAVPSLAEAQPGDLLFPSTGHVQMYVGPGKIIEAPRTGGRVQIVPPRDSYIAIRRPG